MHLQIDANLRVSGIRDVHSAPWIAAYAKHLKESGQFEVPKWLEYVKSSCAKELAPQDADFIFIRAAAIMRHLDLKPHGGVNTLRTVFGSSQNRGVRPSHHRKAAGKIIRHCIQQLEKMNLLERHPNKGFRILSRTGRSSVDQIARSLQ